MIKKEYEKWLRGEEGVPAEGTPGQGSKQQSPNYDDDYSEYNDDVKDGEMGAPVEAYVGKKQENQRSKILFDDNSNEK